MAWIKWNPNPVNRIVGDCAVRAVAKALDVDWETAHVMLDFNAYMMGDISNSNAVIGSVLRQNGFYRAVIPDSCPDCYTVEDFSRDHPDGVYVLGTGTHVVTVDSGDIYDTWDSSGEVPIYYWYQKKEDA